MRSNIKALLVILFVNHVLFILLLITGENLEHHHSILSNGLDNHF